ncbi:bacteriophage lambda head decoration protein D [Rhizobium subbaraonis]|uniref:Bacteriophage lambda head decoration protein D n=1 Tax=Rhizobium subbaraonis TaxID=908946 RepID=A0A285V2W3_9HYPH|nr:head decoration protein [Rhizobium subbaraonis]SOC48287.1 bacteriophage lambda head decoration protein D [Rhizobium subbaraonis]
MATATFSPNDLLVSDVPVITRNVTLISGQNLKRGAVLGNITASDKYTLSLSASADGSQTPGLVLAADADASGGDLVVPAYASGAFDSTKLVFGTGHTAATVEAAFRKEGAPLYVRTLK